MSLLDSMTENTTRPSIIEGASFRLTHDTASVMSVSSTKRYLHQRVRTEVRHDQEISGIRRQARHHVATADAEIRLMRRRLQKLENSKQQESAVTKYDNKKGGARRPSQPLECEDIKLDNVTSQLMSSSNRAQSPSSSHSGSLESLDLDLDLLSDSEDENDGDNENNYTNGDAAGADERNDEQIKPEENGETLQPPHPRPIIKVSPRPTCLQSNESNNPNPNAAVAIIDKAESETAAVSNKANNTARRSSSLRTSTASQLAAKKTQLLSSLATPDTRLSARSSSFTSPAAKRISDK